MFITTAGYDGKIPTDAITVNPKGVALITFDPPVTGFSFTIYGLRCLCNECNCGTVTDNSRIAVFDSSGANIGTEQGVASGSFVGISSSTPIKSIQIRRQQLAAFQYPVIDDLCFGTFCFPPTIQCPENRTVPTVSGGCNPIVDFDIEVTGTCITEEYQVESVSHCRLESAL